MLVRVLVASLAGLAFWLPEPASAQGYPFAYRQPRPFLGAINPYAYPYGIHSYRPSYGSPYWSRPDAYELGGGAQPTAPYAHSGTYRTLCVRLCDGYYFPISFATSRGGLADDADKCSASCGSQARLFYYPNPGGDIETMTDLTGMAYSELPNAFKYRKTLVGGCQCRPEPWSEAELTRHRRYAQEQKGEQKGGAELAASTARRTVHADTPLVPHAPGDEADRRSADRRGTQYRDYGSPPAASEPRVSTIDDRSLVVRPRPIAREPYAGPREWTVDGNGAWGRWSQDMRPYRY
ncbi:MAG: DUF2865 domain-containing protein [Hyphomicrobiaceae bacterium]|nr:MAG: DUF2865 domain-containing protein [Hyphomicrobiaceae bacterium]